MSSFLASARRSTPLALLLLSACASSKEPRPEAAPATVTADQIQQAPGDPIEKLLMSRSPGVWVGRSADGGIAVRIRGGSSLMGNNEPLYIVDGSPFMPGPNGALTGINPYDIASIKVLKDPADLTMYGVRGANGVIIIKTKNKQD
ncbi:MAG TPA: TonB-dependent receptor plug domain-containing protein [Gemmatimonadaceae bacterium]|nr:TonB-dependent receptor plug domain-containing protein [Gemmatimonadaceae bacterium]